MKEKMERWLLFTASVLVVVCASLMITPVECKKSKHISVKLNSKWGSTPLLLETSEFLAKEGEDQFWSYVESIVALDSKGYDEEFEEEMYHLGIKMASKLLTPLQMNLLKFSISLRSNSPAVEMFNHMAHDKKPPGDCESFVEINNMITCVQEAMLGFIDLAEKQPQSMSIKSDHHYPGSKGRPVVVVLYSQIGKQSFNEWHTLLKKLAIDGKIDYILRHYIKESAESRVRLSGYGVELAIKSTEYKAKDDTKVEDGTQGEDEEKEDDVEGFVFSKLKELHPNMRDSLKEFRQYLVDNQADLAPMKVWQLQDLSYQAAEKIMSSDDKLKTLRDVSQNFPVQAKALSRITVSKNLKSEIQKNQKVLENSFGVSPGESSLFINGLQADLDIYDVFTLLETMKSEAKLMEGLHALGKQYNLATEDMSKMQQIDLKDADTNYAVDCRDDSIVWLNNLEKDRKYQTWPSSVQEILRPTFPGMLRHIRRNLFNAIFFVNPVDKRYMELLKMAEAFYVHNAPTRIGLVFVVNNDPEVDGLADPGVAMLRAFNYIRKNDNVIKALSFITDLYEAAQEGQITIEFVLQEFVNAYDAEPGEIFGQKSDYDELRLVYERVKEDDITSDVVLDVFKAKFPKAKHEKVYDSVSEYDLNRQEGYEFFERTGLGQLPQVLMNGVPMKKDELGADEFEEAIVSAILKQTTELQKSVYHGFIYDGQDIFEHLMTRSNVMPRLNSRVLNPGEKYLDLSKDMPGTVVENPEAFKLLSPSDMSAALASNLHYVAKKEEEILRPVTNWIVADVNTKEGRALLYEGIKQLKHTNSMRLGLIHNPAGEVTEENSFISQAVQVSLETLPVAMAKSFITKLLKEDYVEALAKESKPLEDLAVNNMDFASYDKALKERKIEFYASHQAFCQKALDFEPGQMGVISNGRIIGPFKEGELFVQQDFSLLDKFMYKTSAEKIEEKLKPLELEPATASDLLLKVSTLLASVPHKDSRKEVPLKHLEHSVIQIPPRNDGPAYDIVAILDPSSKAAQKYTPLIMVLQEVANVNIKVFLNCRDKLSEMPLKSFYRYVLEPEVRFSVDSKVATGPVAQFDDMPEQPILTLGMDPPESWLVEAIWSPHDLDNIHLSEVQKAVSAVFELEHLLVEGHCYDSNSGQPPRGLQFTLGTDNNPAQLDTIVMANLGYFQLKASPGAWNLKLRAGRSNEIYNIASHDYTDSPPDSPDVVVVIDNFKSKIIKVRVNKKAGKETEDLLSDDKEEPQGLWDSISNTITGKAGGTAEAETDTDQTINIFTLASGHLYERLLRIMIVSVMSTTKSNVKFWFLKNYLSPTFKDFIPHLAQEYGFEYELVQYKWPRWLHQQTEKQRVIWGYKILFLDVLFPLNVNKIIFVDADQIVRSDLQELVDLDLEGAPYGYTPFCDSRTEMDGFRFWRSGYWASHLAGRKYHISALYVVDLKKFRKIAAGDRLRGQYQGLSQDPNSLSNLDQDLPNNMIHQVNIKSLPQEWLWCETWCSDKEKASAKTIDLCNNPLTKEPKLTAAARIVPEWTDYDLKIKALWDKTYKKKDGDTSKSTPEKEDEPDKPDSEKPTPHGEL